MEEKQELNQIGTTDKTDTAAEPEAKKNTIGDNAKSRILDKLNEVPLCNFKEACQLAAVNRTWAYEMRQRDREFDIQVEAALQRNREDFVDTIESKLWTEVSAKDSKDMQTFRWVMETLGKRRGYVKRIETAPLGAAGFTPTDLDNMTGEEMSNAYSAMLKARGGAAAT